MKRITTFLFLILFALTLQGQKGITYQGSSSLMDAGKGIFTPPSTESWSAYGTNTITNDAGALKVTYVDDQYGGQILLKATFDINTNLVVGQWYRSTFKAKINAEGANITVHPKGGVVGSAAINVGSYTIIEFEFQAGNVDQCYHYFDNFSAGEIIWIDEWSIQEWYPDGRVIRAYDANQPLNIDDVCSVWLDGKDASTFTLDGTSVDDWTGKGVLGITVSNGNDDATRPTYDVNTGRVTFTAANSTFLQSAAFGSALTQPNTVFIVYKITGALNAHEKVFCGLAGYLNAFWYNGSIFIMYASNILNDGATNANDNIHCGLFNGASSEYWINGVSKISGDIGAGNLDGITLGSRNNVTAYFADCEIMEVIVYNDEISDTDRDKITGYLSNKWDIPAVVNFKGYIIITGYIGLLLLLICIRKRKVIRQD